MREDNDHDKSIRISMNTENVNSWLTVRNKKKIKLKIEIMIK